MSNEKTVYCGGGKKQNDTWLKVTINPDKLKDYIEEFNGNKFVKLNINIKDQPDQFGKDVSISVDTWKPDNQPIEGVSKGSDDDLPF
jgi:hypothetical protein